MNFLHEKWYVIGRNILFQDRQSIISPENNGRKSLCKKSMFMNIPYFFIKNQVAKGNVEVNQCTTKIILGYFFMKLL